MKYKGYFGEIKSFDEETGFMHGEVLGLKDVITFQFATGQGLIKAFHESIDDYLAWCKEQGEKPEKTFSGNLRLRMNPDLHAQLAFEAEQNGTSLNNFINEKLRR